MSDFFTYLSAEIQEAKIINDMAKIQIKFDIITPFVVFFPRLCKILTQCSLPNKRSPRKQDHARRGLFSYFNQTKPIVYFTIIFLPLWM